MTSDGDTPSSTQSAMPCYRLGRHHLILGIVCLACFLAMDLGSVYVAYWNVDGSFARPKLAALVFGVFWSCWTLAALWMIIAYFRERLFVSGKVIIQHGCIRKRTITISDVIQVKWKRFPRGGCVTIRSHFSRIKIYLDNFTGDEQVELIGHFHEMFSPDIQEDWTQFTECRLRSTLNRTPKKSRAAAAICAFLLFLFAVVFSYCWIVGLGVQWLIIGAVNAFGGVWYLWRICKWRDEAAADVLSKP